MALILGSPSRGVDRGEDGPVRVEPRYWRDHIAGFASARTEAIVREETDWQQQGYWWYSSYSDAFESGDHILLFDQSTGWAEVVVVKDTTRTAVPTPDGRHFVAYQRTRGWHRRRLNRNLWTRFADIGLAIERTARVRRRRLTEGQWNRIATLFQK